MALGLILGFALALGIAATKRISVPLHTHRCVPISEMYLEVSYASNALVACIDHYDVQEPGPYRDMVAGACMVYGWNLQNLQTLTRRWDRDR